MFGFQVFFANRNMFIGTYEDGITLRLSKEGQSDIMAQKDEIVPFSPMGQSMKEYVLVPEHFLSDKEFIRYWLDKSYEYVSKLPPKEKKAKTKRPQGDTE